MTEKEQIQNQIQELQEKLQKLEEVENEKMEFEDEGRFHSFHYNGKSYHRLEYTVIPIVWWFVSLSTLEYPIPVYEKVMNSELNKKLEELYQKQIVPEELEENEWKSVALRFGEKLSSIGPCNYYNYTPDEWFDWVVNTYEKVCDYTVNLLNKEKLKKAQKRGERVEDFVSKNWYVDANVLLTPTSNSFYDLIADWWDEIFTNGNPSGQNIETLVETVEKWLPKEQSANSQNAYVESAVEGFNDCLQQIKSKLR